MVDTEIKVEIRGRIGFVDRGVNNEGGKIIGLGARGQNRHRLGLTLNARGGFPFSFSIYFKYLTCPLNYKGYVSGNQTLLVLSIAFHCAEEISACTPFQSSSGP
jgi:hypothetical protein